ncbi:hypothetical protein [Myxosarcina sp. GI1]|uniref:hypothetical protein n=1 Tax=Myxosarcina sp. GI1 TaxID=1541065 RepID=UPI000567298C|nr:hypothetical protein [Myxosarcina sp. GI1]
MDKNEHLEKNASKITEAISPTQPQEIPTQEVTASYDGGVHLLLIWIVSIVGFCFLLKKSKSQPDKTNSQNLSVFQHFTQPDCEKCRFFDKNSYLKCAVHPIYVGKINAKDCSDYWQRDRRKFFYH